MEYKGKLYGKVGNNYFPLEATTDDFERLQANQPPSPTTEDVKRWYQLLVGKGEEAALADIRATLSSPSPSTEVGTMLTWLKEYIKNTPPEQVKKEWAEIEALGFEAPNVFAPTEERRAAEEVLKAHGIIGAECDCEECQALISKWVGAMYAFASHSQPSHEEVVRELREAVSFPYPLSEDSYNQLAQAITKLNSRKCL